MDVWVCFRSSFRNCRCNGFRSAAIETALFIHRTKIFLPLNRTMLGYRNYYSDSIRRKDWDYRRSSWYFITICTDARLPYFGEVRDGVVGLSSTGCVAASYWQKIVELNERAVLDAFIVMPNHVHGLLGLLPERKACTSPPDAEETTGANEASAEASLESNDASAESARSSTTKPEASNPKGGHDHMSRISPEAGSVSTILRSYKSAVTKRVRGSLRTDFGWQRRFDDHIVRNRRAFQRIRRYIRKNPASWKRDPNHPDRLNP